MSIKENAQELLEDFELFDDWTDKYEYIISLGKELNPMDESTKTEENLVKGCQSRVWLTAELKEGKVEFSADSDAVISKGIIALLVRVLGGHEPKELLENDFAFIDEIGLKEHLSPNRSNGLVGMMKQMKNYALAFSQA